MRDENARIVVVTDEDEHRDVIASVLRGQESGIIGHADQSRMGALMVLLATFKQIGSVRNVFLLGEAPSSEVASLAIRSGIAWLDPAIVPTFRTQTAGRHFIGPHNPSLQHAHFNM